MIPVFLIDGLERRNRADNARTLRLSNPQPVGFNEISNHHLVIILGLKICFEHFQRGQVLHILLLIGKDVRFMLVAQIIIDHTPYRRIARTGYQRNDLNGMLSVKDIVHPVPSADLNRIDLIRIKVLGGPQNMSG